MIFRFISRVAITLAGCMALAFFYSPAANAQRENYRDFQQFKDSLLDRVWAFNREHPGFHVDSLRAHLFENFSFDNAVASASSLRPQLKKKLSPDKIYEKCKHSSLIVCKMEHNPQTGQDAAYPIASSVALTEDGICATNYHVVADLLLSSALDHKKGMESLRFLSDFDGRIYPIETILYADPVNDMAIIRVSTASGKLVPANIGGELTPGEKVFCLSHPSGSMYNFTDGIVSGRTRSLDKSNGQVLYSLAITADYGSGASGGPIFDECGNLVAIVCSTYSLYAQPQQYRNFQMAYKWTVPVFLIKECFN